MKTAHTQTQTEFVIQRLRQGQTRREIWTDFSAIWRVSVRSFDERLRVAKETLAKERAELDKHRLEVLKSEQTQAIRTSHEYVLNLQALVDKLNDQFERAKTPKERIDIALAIVRLIGEINRMQGYYATAKNEVSLDVVPQENTIGRYFEMVDARLRQERELNDMLD